MNFDFLNSELKNMNSQSDFENRSYVEKGYFRRGNLDDAGVQSMQILWQEPTATVLVKKRMFSSLADYNDSKYLDSDEKLFLSAAKQLFRNKCKQIATYEQLTKIDNVVKKTGVTGFLLPIIIGLVDSLSNLSNINLQTDVNSSVSNLKKSVDKIKSLIAFTGQNQNTTWLSENIGITSNLLTNMFGNETGIIELTNFTSISTNTSVDFKNTTANLSFKDPYGYSRITQYDIELALSQSTNKAYYIGNMFQDQINATIQATIGKLNSIRKARNVQEIEFHQFPFATVGKHLIIILANIGLEILFESAANPIGNAISIFSPSSSIKIDPRFIDGSENVVGINALSNDEADLVKSIISTIQNNFQTIQNNKALKISSNKETNYARRKMHQNFLAKCIIQPKDVIHVFFNSHLKKDQKIFNAFHDSFNQFDFMNSAANSTQNITDTFNSLFNPSSTISLQLEKEVFAGKDFPSYLWLMFRNYFMGGDEGTQTFSGVVDYAKLSYQGGVYSYSVVANSNLDYLQQGQINFNPGVANFNGPLLDPLTPFVSKIDSDNTINFYNQNVELLPENRLLLSSGNIKYKSGPNIGKTASEEGLQSDVHKHTDEKNGDMIKVIHSPDGFVYKWKQGIGIMTQNDPNLLTPDTKRSGGVNIIKAFGGQDMINMMSLLVTGQPYNYMSYYKNMLESFSTIDTSAKSGNNSVPTYFDDLKTRNKIWGNFTPFKSLTVNEESYSALLSKQISIQKTYSDVNAQLNELTSQQNILASYASAGLLPDGEATQELQKKLTELNSTLTKKLDGADHLIFTGNDISVDNDSLINNNDKIILEKTRRTIRKKINNLTKKVAWQVRANQDRNFFIVDDTYDKDQDIAAYDKLISQVEAFSNTYTTVFEKISEVKKLMLDVFIYADSQGNIRFTLPTYNRMPSSVYYKMIIDKQNQGIQIYPQYLESLISDQLTYYTNQLEVQEDYIRLLSAVLGYVTDDKVEAFINQDKASQFKFITTSDGKVPSNHEIGNVDTSPEAKLKNLNTSLSNKKDVINQQSKLTNLFSLKDRLTFITNYFNASLSSDTTPLNNSGNLNSTRINECVQRLSFKTGTEIKIDDYITQSDSNSIIQGSTAASINYTKISEDVATYLSKRQNSIKSISKALKNYNESLNLNQDKSLQRKLLFSKSANTDIPETLAHLIEDESYDDYGPNSGKRFVIKDENIISLDINENPPECTMIAVTGQISPYNSPSNGPPQGNSLPGVAPTSQWIAATAVDYDMWRMYGFKSSSTIQLPFFTDAKTQCAPLAVSLLNKNRHNIIKGTVNLVGNEYYQPGDVVFIEPSNMLFLVNDVSHNLTMGASFTTTLSLSYGHIPGEYIPNPLDIIGKFLYNSRDDKDLINYRHDDAVNDKYIGTFVLTFGLSDSSKNEYTVQNDAVLKNALYLSSYLAVNNSNDQFKTISQIQLRYYTSSSITGNIDANTRNKFIQQIKDQLSGKTDKSNSNFASILSDNKSDDFIVDVEIKLGNEEETKSPSSGALAIARQLQDSIQKVPSQETKAPVGNKDLQDKLKNNGSIATNKIFYALINNTIDVYITTKDIPVNGTKDTTPGPDKRSEMAAQTAPNKSTTYDFGY